jgi:oligopeptidase B
VLPEHLVESDLTRPERLVAYGGSAGGLLMGAVANLAPHLFAGVLAQVPFVDPLTTILDPSLPLDRDRVGRMGKSVGGRRGLRIHEVVLAVRERRRRRYPPILAMTSLNDTRVYFVEPAKWVAALRHTKTGAHPVLLSTQMTSGHGGISGRYERWKEVAFQYAWLLAAAQGDQ